MITHQSTLALSISSPLVNYRIQNIHQDIISWIRTRAIEITLILNIYSRLKKDLHQNKHNLKNMDFLIIFSLDLHIFDLYGEKAFYVFLSLDSLLPDSGTTRISACLLRFKKYMLI